MNLLNIVADSQAKWSLTANKLKADVDWARWLVFALSFAGALLAAIATQWPGREEPWHLGLTLLSASMLTISAFVVQRALSKDAVQRHVRARMASEALKRECFLFAAGAPSEDRANALALADKQDAIEKDVSDLLLFQVTNTERGSCPRDRLSFDEYLARRVNKQIKYYRSKANDYAPVAARLRTAEWVIALFGALVSAIAGITKIPGFDIAALTALLTTLGGIVVTHRQASHYEEIISTYRATANRLEYATQTKDPQISLGDFAQKVETIIEGETKSWAAGWSKT
jgi:SMODS and SLOG-associating 2TM effector domain 1/Protein of unknown function (DUF4231)